MTERGENADTEVVRALVFGFVACLRILPLGVDATLL
jgi:hypothetical protein